MLGVATGAFWDTLLVVASGALFILLADWCLTRSYSDLICDDELYSGASHRHSVPTICLWPEWRPPVSDQAASTHSSSSRFVVSAKIPFEIY